MASLALFVSIIFLIVLISGPLALFFSRIGMKILATILGLFAILVGVYWFSVAPFPVSLIGVLSLISGGLVIKKI